MTVLAIIQLPSRPDEQDTSCAQGLHLSVVQGEMAASSPILLAAGRAGSGAASAYGSKLKLQCEGEWEMKFHFVVL